MGIEENLGDPSDKFGVVGAEVGELRFQRLHRKIVGKPSDVYTTPLFHDAHSLER